MNCYIVTRIRSGYLSIETDNGRRRPGFSTAYRVAINGESVFTLERRVHDVIARFERGDIAPEAVKNRHGNLVDALVEESWNT